jgi:Tol biopolymer transport system component
MNRPDKALMGVRTEGQGQYSAYTLLIEGNSVSKIGAKFGYTSWHPSGKLAVYSIIDPELFFRTAANEVRDLFDPCSMLAYFLVDSKTIRTSPEISRKDRLETWPVWSADGRFLYFCSAPMLWTDETKVPPDGGYDRARVKYDLVRISYDIERDQWGKVETAVSAQDTGMSIAMPRVSPDGRWLTFCMCEYGSFAPWQESSDIYVVDMKTAQETGRYEHSRLELNSDKSESWHSWSSNSRWIAFSSKREHGIFTRCYISYVDESGRAYKPLIVPQKDPAYYGYCLESFNTPELVTGPIPATGERLAGVEEVSVRMPITMATPKAQAASQQEYLPQQE